MAPQEYSNRPHHLDLVDQISRTIPADYAHSRLLLAIAQFCRFDDGVWMAWPSINTLRQACGYSDSRNVRLLLEQLKKLGLISIFRRYRASNIYVLHLTKITAFDPVRAGLRKAKHGITMSIKKLITAAKEWLKRKRQMIDGEVYIDHADAMAAAKSHGKAVNASTGKAPATSNTTKKPQHYSGPSPQAKKMIVDSIQWQLGNARKAGDSAKIAKLTAELAAAEAALLA
ncbi:hypothetical protein ABKY47_002104 [Aeromonas hydrophila]